MGLKYNNICVTKIESATRCGSVWLEHLVWDQGVAGSNPVTSTYNQIVMQVWFNGRTSAFQAEYVGSIPITCFFLCLNVAILSGTVVVHNTANRAFRTFCPIAVFLFFGKYHPNIWFHVSASIFFPSFSGLL